MYNCIFRFCIVLKQSFLSWARSRFRIILDFKRKKYFPVTQQINVFLATSLTLHLDLEHLSANVRLRNVDESLLLKVEPCSLCRRSQRLEEKTARSQNLHLFLSPLSRPHMRVTINKKVNNCGLSKESDGSN